MRLSDARIGLRARLRLAAQRIDGPRPARPPFLRLMREGSYPFSPITRRIKEAPHIERTKQPRSILLLPGFLASPVTMDYLGQQMKLAGHRVWHWSAGFNLGATPQRFSLVEQQLVDLSTREQCAITLIGWSLGGLFARELAKRQPQAVAKVITLGSPFSGDPRSNNAWRLYQMVAGHSVDNPPVGKDINQKPPVPTVAFWSARDGVVSPRSACGKPQERDRAIALRCTHMGFSYDRRAIEAVLRELERD